MGLLGRARSSAIQASALAALVPHLPELYRGGHSNAACLLERNATRLRDRPALRFEDESYTWGEVNAHANRWARVLLARGIARGEVVALVMDNRPEYVFALLGLSKLRVVAACVNTHVRGPALAHAVRIARPTLVVLGSEHASAAPEIHGAAGGARVLVHTDRGGAADPDAIDGALARASSSNLSGPKPLTEEAMAYLYTSGTTGLPKAAVVTNQRFVATAYGFGKLLHQATPDDVIYVALPLYHGTGQWGGLGACLATGATLALRRKFSASSFWSDAVRFGATRITYIGELCRYLLHQAPSPDERRHRVSVAVGNGLRPDVWPRFQERFGITMIREFYGATEGNAPLANIEGRAGMVGRIGVGQALLACDPETGKVLRDARGRGKKLTRAGETGLFVGRISRVATFDGYVDANATEAKVLRDVLAEGDAWFNTGDLLTLHEDGWLSFADRVGDTFRWKGENVSTNEVAELLNSAPGVLESNVYGVAIPGTDGKAGMASLRVSEAFDPALFGRHVLEKLPRYARPLFVRLQHEMRVTATLKHQKVDYRNEGFDPKLVRDPLLVLVRHEYRPLTPELHAAILAGTLVPG
jgi:fatty-acyl-CoA synthase